MLIAEDNPGNVKLATRLLEKRGHKVAVANNGQEALDLLDAELYDTLGQRAQRLATRLGEACDAAGFTASFPVVGTWVGVL